MKLPSMEDVRETLVLVDHLPAESRYVAELRGGPQFIGWTEDRMLAATTHDLLIALLTGLAGQSVKRDDFWPRPKKTVSEVKDHVGTIAEFSTHAFMKWLTS